jgi:hypothetical protein
MKAAGGGATAAGLGSLGTAAFSSSAGAQASSDDNSFQIDVIEGTTGDIKADPTSASNTYAEDGDLIAYQWGNTAAESEGEGDGSRYLTYSGSSGGTVSSRPTFNIDFNNYTADVTVDVDSNSLDIAVVCYSAANGGTTDNPAFDPAGPQSEVDRDTATGVSGSQTFTVDIPQVNNTNQAAGGYTTIQGAVDAASSGDTIEVEPDTYQESLTLDTTSTQDITINSVGDHTNTTIDVDGSNILFGDTTDDNTLDGFTITDNSGGTNELVLIGSFALNTTVQNCVIDGNGGNASACVRMYGATEDETNTVNNSTISNCIVREANITNIEINAYRGLIEDCDIDGGNDTTDNGINLRGDININQANNDSEVADVEIRRCDFKNHGFQSVFSPTNINGGSNSVILGPDDTDNTGQPDTGDEPTFRNNIIRDTDGDVAARFANFAFDADMNNNAFEFTDGTRSSDPIADGLLVVEEGGLNVSDASPITDTSQPSGAGSSLGPS